MFASFTVSGASLALLRVGESGVIAGIRSANPALEGQLHHMGLSLGTVITLEQRFPQFVVCTCEYPVELTQAMIQAIYVRLSAT